MYKCIFVNAATAAFLFYAFGTAQAVELQSHLSAQGRYSVQKYQKSSPVSPTRYSSTGSQVFDVESLLSSQAIINDYIQGDVSIALSWQQHDHTEKHEIRLLTGGMTATNEAQTQRLTAGKLAVHWSQDSLFHPIDFFGRYNQPKSTLGINRIDYFHREGEPMVRWQGSTNTISYDFIWADASKKGSMSTSQQFAGRGLFQLDEMEVSLIAEKSASYKPRWGATWSQGIGEQWTLYSEYLLSKNRDIPRLVEVSPEISLGSNGALPARYAYKQNIHGRNWQKLLVTLRYALQQGGSVEGTFFYNGDGMNDREWDHWVSRQKSVARTLSDDGIIPWLQNGNSYISMLGDSARLMQNNYLRRYYASVRYDSIDRFTQGSVEVNLIYGLEDNSLTLWTEGQYPLTSHLYLKPFIMLQTTAQGEGAMTPVNSLVGVNFNYTFF
ncbi:hypothetical protein [Xenorhabdus entomophaga]|uniref:hypothetical protein n=1 Tax=Xenorhabdus entomophaga TaxID=3136257 RepID=UPI0030F43A98